MIAQAFRGHPARADIEERNTTDGRYRLPGKLVCRHARRERRPAPTCGADRGRCRDRRRRLRRPAQRPAARPAGQAGGPGRAPPHRLGRFGPQWRLRRSGLRREVGRPDRPAWPRSCTQALCPVAARRRSGARGHRGAGPPRPSHGHRKAERFAHRPGSGIRRPHARPGREAGGDVRALGHRPRANPARHGALPSGDSRSVVLPCPPPELRAGFGRRHRGMGRHDPRGNRGNRARPRRPPLAIADAARRDRGASRRAGRQCRSWPCTAAHRAGRAARRHLRRRHRQDGTRARPGDPLVGRDLRHTARRRLLPRDRRRPAAVGRGASPPIRASHRACAR